MKIHHWLAAACMVASLPTHATSVFNPIELKDHELAQLRGRYVMPDRIVYFGMTMTSTWQNASGDVLGAQTTLHMQQNTIKPQFYVSLINKKGDGSTPTDGTGSITGGGGLTALQGVTQSTRTAGAGSLTVSSSNGGVQLAIQAGNNQGDSMQRIAAGGVLQATNLMGTKNQVQNLTQLNIVLRNDLPSPGTLNCNLDQLKSLRSAGY